MPLGAAAGKRVRLVAIERRGRGLCSAEAARSVGKVAIGNENLAEVSGANIFALPSPCQAKTFAIYSPNISGRRASRAPGNTQDARISGLGARSYTRSIVLAIPGAGAELSDVHILIIDDDEASQDALQQVLDSEGWRVCVAPIPSEAMRELANGHWTLVVVNVALADLTGPLFTTLKELAQAEADPGTGHKRLRVLFLVPLLAARWARPVLDQERLPYAMKPLNLNDFLEKVSDLLLEAGAIPQPIRSISTMAAGKERRQKERRAGRDRRNGKMFASREDYMMTEEEIAEYEKQEAEERKKREEEEKKREML
jgi:DNA-binding response OmpR family regulator